MPSKLQHYVQQFYLEAFADADRRTNLWVYDKRTLQVRSQGIKNSAAENYYYCLERPDGSRDDLLDRAVVDKFENRGVPIIRKWRAQNRPVVLESHLEAMSYYLAVAYVRSPRARRDSQELMIAEARRMLLDIAESDHRIEQFLSDHPEFNTTKEKVREALLAAQDPDKISLTPSGNAVVASPFLIADEIARGFVLMHWSFLEAPSPINFVTCDSPLSVYVTDKRGNALVGVGFGLAGAEITFPISPRFSLRLSWKRSKPFRRIAEREAWAINRRMSAQALRYVYGSRFSKRVARIVQEEAFREPKQRVLSHGPLTGFQKVRRST